MSRLALSQEEEDAAIIKLYMEDSSPERATDMLNTLITVYNEETIEDKTRVAVNTDEFIRERLRIIESELGAVESDIEALKTQNQGSGCKLHRGYVHPRQPTI